jgi:hypothetical protein
VNSTDPRRRGTELRVRRSLTIVSAGAIAIGSIACGLTADFSNLQGGDAGLVVCDAGCDEQGDDAAEDSSAVTGSCPPMSCPIKVTNDTFDNSYDGYITYQNKGMGDEVNPTVEFTVPSGVSLYPVGCAGAAGFMDQGVPNTITSLACSQSGTTISYAFTGTLPAGSQIAIYYTTNLPTEDVATCITVTATSCP